MNGRKVDSVGNEWDAWSPTRSKLTSVSIKSTPSCLNEFLESLHKRRMPALSNSRTNTKSAFLKELSTYRSLAQKRYNELVGDENSFDPVSQISTGCFPCNTFCFSNSVRFLATTSSSTKDTVIDGSSLSGHACQLCAFRKCI